MSKLLYCAKCRTYLGEVRYATLKKNIVHMCGKCMEEITGLNNFMNGIFGQGRKG